MIKRRLFVLFLLMLLSVGILSGIASVSLGAVAPSELLAEPSSAFMALGRLPVWQWTATRLKLAAGQRQIGDVYIGKNRLLKLPESADNTVFASARRQITALAGRTSAPLTVAVVPDAALLYESELSALISLPPERQMLEQFYNSLPAAVSGVNLLTALSEVREENIFYRTDEHWTSLGAYYGYAAIGKQMGLTVEPKEDFTIRYIEHEALGGLYRKAQYGGHFSESVDFYQPSDGMLETEVTVYQNGGEKKATYTELYRTEYLDTPDFPAAFLGPEAERITVRVPTNTTGKRLLLIGDQNAHIAAQFLIRHYDEITILPTSALTGEPDMADYQQVLILTGCAALQHEFQGKDSI